ncbi:MFS transporter [Bacillus velezensis]|nr:MFS transporter [Bacillus velezensis]MBM7028156.1 MFS transporter [Bacillus velezensis]
MDLIYSRVSSACCLFVYDSPRTGSASDRNISSQVRKRATLKLFYLLAAVFIFIIPFTISPMALYVVQILIGFSLGIIFPLLLGMSIESVPADMRATSMGAYQALYALGIFGGPLAEGFFNDWLGLRAGFYFAAGARAGGCHTCSAHMWGADAKESSEKCREDAAKYYQTWF